ncbi:MAG: RluA family pseudouridine synthase [Pirellulales bacterium]
MRAPWPVLYEDNHLLVVVKPAMLPTMGVAADRPSLVSQAKDYLKHKYNKPGNVYLGIVSRLDAPVSGVLVIARTSKAAARLTDGLRRRQMHKIYWALVEGRIEQPQAELVDLVRKDDRHRRMHIARSESPGVQEARLRYRLLRAVGPDSLLEVELVTGRKHQIRLQLSHHGHPIRGDRKYGGQRGFAEGIALHARRLAFMHPVRGEPLEFVAPLPASWQKAGIDEAASRG